MYRPLLNLLFSFCVLAGTGRAWATEAVTRQIGHGVQLSTPGPVDLTLLESISAFNLDQGATFAGWDSQGQGILTQRSAGKRVTIAKVPAPQAPAQAFAVLDQAAQIGPWSPPGAPPSFLFVNDQQGDERYQISLFDLTTGQSRPLTQGDSRNALPIWSANGESIAFTSNRRNGVSSDVYLLPVDNPGEPMLVASRGALIPQDWSADGTLLAVQDYHSVNSSRLYIFDLKRNTLHELNDERSTVAAYGKAQFAHSSRGMFLLTDNGGEFMGLEYYKITRRARFHPTRITHYRTVSGSEPWDVSDFEVSFDGRWVAWLVNEAGFDQLYLRDMQRGRTRKVSDLPPGLIYGLSYSAQSDQLGFTVSSAAHPEQAWSLDLRSMQPSLWAEDAQRSPGVPAEQVFVPAPDGGDNVEVPAFVYRPAGNGPHPVVVWLHGGPESQFRPGYHSRIQYWASRMGIAVVAPNVRGSTGYGREYSRMDNGKLREGAIADIGMVFDWIVAQKDLDGERMCVYGSSYGGFLAMAAMARWPDRLRCGMELAGISDISEFLRNTNAGRQQLRRFEYGDENDPQIAAFLDQLSPLGQVQHIRAPLLIAHGRNDARVPIAQSERMAAALRAQGNLVWTVLADGEGHTWLNQANRDALDSVMAAFLRRHLLGTGVDLIDPAANDPNATLGAPHNGSAALAKNEFQENHPGLQ